MRIAVLGAGAWGTALAVVYARSGHAVRLWCWQEDEAQRLRSARENARYLPGFPFPESLFVSADLAETLADAEIALIATPVAGLRAVATQLAQKHPQLPFLWACKGLEATSGLLPHEVVAQAHAQARCGALTGPSFALEVARGLPTAVAVAGEDAGFVAECVKRLNLPTLRLYANADLVGAEIGGAVKNVMAIAAGISDGLGLGNNARAALLTRGLTEITRFGVACGARRETFMGLTGLGDLILTATSDLSRNRRVGLALAEGKRLPVIQEALGQVAEGVGTAFEVRKKAALLGIEMPITEAVCQVIEGRLSPAAAVERLMSRQPKAE
ncbi:MAG: NAD(P)-dependent glycerol-3-phosphate dehydrogenase [Rhodocyclaceae bacterium]|nr:NAD(P)-dependent glycerol-3-phosphate dehydrogenase [Rhodocyclaceae bacterium]